MPKIREGYRQVASQLPMEMVAGLEALAEQTGRTFAAELAAAIRRHLAAPPRIIELKLPAEIVKKPPAKPRKPPA